MPSRGVYVPRRYSRGGISLLAEGHTVGTLVLLGVTLVGAHQNPLQSAVVACCGMVGALMDGALDALVGIVHNETPPFLGFRV